MTDEQQAEIRRLLDSSGISPEESAGEDWAEMSEAEAAQLIAMMRAIEPEEEPQ
ncbi:MAG: hypothetical protein ABSH09_26605 [Bryobacteraceae bacterium]|jgi:hypothetical protein